jgi:hypothetical protein
LEKGEKNMYTFALNPFGKMNLKAAMLLPILLLSMFTMVPLVTTQAVPNLAKISPALWNEMANAGESVNVLIQTVTNDYSGVVKQINDLGGSIGFLFKYVNALSAAIPKGKMIELTENSLIERILYDTPRQMASAQDADMLGPIGDDLDQLLARPTVPETADFEPVTFTPEDLATMEPENFWNTKAMAAQPIWPVTGFGAGSLVVIIDTGIWSGHFMFASTNIIGGADVSPEAADPVYGGWNKISNHYHGTHVAGIVASTGGIIVSPTSTLYKYARGLEIYGGITLPTDGLGRKTISLLGMAPMASLYIVKVFTHTGAGVPTSYIMAGMQHALDLKLVSGFDVDIISMSIGGSNVYDGRDPEDLLVNTITANGIALVAAAGNEGPASMTVARPGSAHTSITAAAAANPVNTKAYWDYSYQTQGIGSLLFTSATPQIYSFSSRGPSSDGRQKPTLSATGIYVLSAYNNVPGGQGIAWASGTSMATPAISGGTALLNAWAEMNLVPASPEDYTQALTAGAVLLPGYNNYDQGAGYLNAANSLAALIADSSYGDVAPPLPPTGTLMDISNIPIVGSGVYTTTISNLAPGHKMEFVFKAKPSTNSIRVTLSGVNVGAMNPLGANSFEVYIGSAIRTTYAYYVDSANVWGDGWLLVTDGTVNWHGAITGVFWDDLTLLSKIQPGFIKVVIENDWTSYDNASANVEIKVTETPIPTPDLQQTQAIANGQNIGWMAVPVPKWASRATLMLWWTGDWSVYPTSDIDMAIYWDDGYNYDAATLNSPERAVLDNPTFIYVLIMGYYIPAGSDTYTLMIYFEK